MAAWRGLHRDLWTIASPWQQSEVCHRRVADTYEDPGVPATLGVQRAAADVLQNMQEVQVYNMHVCEASQTSLVPGTRHTLCMNPFSADRLTHAYACCSNLQRTVHVFQQSPKH